ncbi:four helix bundle protein [Spirosoma montaniterrae]|uniref:Four helix bundle protein n=1 Tax=Spirosoma montaniterrae TaxID=1178516 RepID=A0A1P9WWF3_9BACT|nr:four helix bundle protein [Spirosoma montaniterrae]AQG79717.1 four helix bundle protein [Spirosoma montaniterrae]
MPTVNQFEDLQAWQKARTLSKAIHQATRDKAFQDDYDLRRQIRRAGGSVMDNIAEGFGRGSRGDFVQFLGIARGSLTEVKSQLYRSLDNGCFDRLVFDELYTQASEVGRMIDGLLLYLNNSSNKGRRYSKGAEKTDDER